MTRVTFPGLNKSLTVTDQRLLEISDGKQVTSKKITPRQVNWSQLCARLEKPIKTHETFKDYLGMPRDEQTRIKDVGYFVGATFKDSLRHASSWSKSDVLQLDADFADDTTIDDAKLILPFSWAVFSTHKHSSKSPRLRFVIPLSRSITDADAYQAVGRKVAQALGIERFDRTTYEPVRAMFWPSHSIDGEYVFDVNDGPWLDVDEWLSLYEDWKDHRKWPTSGREKEVVRKHAERAGDPYQKPGLIGAFCRAYSIQDAIGKFLPDKFVEGDPGRYTYIGSTTSNGAVVYEDKFLYSHHSTDPGCNQLLNAFDLVRLHRYGPLDETDDANEIKLELSKRPSHKHMLDAAHADADTRIELSRVLLDRARSDFAEEYEGDEWKEQLEYLIIGNKSLIAPSVHNISVFLAHHPSLKKRIGYNIVTGNLVAKSDLPWRKIIPSVNGTIWDDHDDAQFYSWLAREQSLDAPMQKVLSALLRLRDTAAFDPLASWLAGLTWDGTPRLDSFIIRHMGAEDTEYTRAVTRKWMTAACARVFQPGVKFDHMLTLQGAQDLGKSGLLATVAKHLEWFGDEPPPIDQIKELKEWMRGKWIIEFGELASFTGKEIEAVRSFITARVDRYRDAYGRRSQEWPRRCVLSGSTNDDHPLRDAAGNRRFWVVAVTRHLDAKELAEEVDQLWAEAMMRYSLGEPLWLEDEKVRAMAEQVQIDMLEDDGLSGPLAEFANQLVPINHGDSVQGAGADFDDGAQLIPREYLIPLEIFEVLMNGKRAQYDKRSAYKITRAIRKLGGWSKQTASRQTGTKYGRQRVFYRVRPADLTAIPGADLDRVW